MNLAANDDPVLAAIAAQLAQAWPGMPKYDGARFAQSIRGGEPYAPGVDSIRRPDVACGTITQRICPAGNVYPGIEHEYRVYVPAQYVASGSAGLMVCFDGTHYLGPDIDVPAVLDNLIAAGELPPMVAVFVQPGARGPGLPIYGGEGNRSVEYDSVGDACARFVLQELLPHATAGLAISSDPGMRIVCGLSSGGICAFNLAWERPDAFGKVVSHCGSFVNLRGGHTLAPAVRAAPAKSLRVFLQTGVNDLDICFGSWVVANQALASALSYRGYDHQLVIGQGGHSLAHGGAIFPDTLRWMFRDWRAPESPMESRP
jgi:enterochelin esterase-like enzyme